MCYSESMRIVVTGGAGYIGSHTVVELMAAGHTPIVVDNFCNSSAAVLQRIEQIVGRRPILYHADLNDQAAISHLFATCAADAVIHFAGLKAVGESVEQPLRYYRHNLESTLALLTCMQQASVKQLVFSSSATVYGTPQQLPITEQAPIAATNPYGHTKVMIEQMLHDLAACGQGWRITSLRYFNPIGAHETGLLGEEPSDTPNNLLPYISQVAVGRRQALQIFGDDYPTPDGTGVRDYVHVIDVAGAHVAALERLGDPNQHRIYNIGTGRGTSVLELVQAFEQATGCTIPYRVVARRPGDVAVCYADVGLAQRELRWVAQRTIQQACQDAWQWQRHNPDGYATTR